jgi:dipeptidyl aminopeptidase/acylaminoacyl peptidase
MTGGERDIRRDLLSSPIPEELEAQRRAWNVVRTAHAEREALPRRRNWRPLVALAVLTALLTAAVSPPGQAVADWIHDSFVEGEKAAEPALFRLPTRGRLLVVSERGPWIVPPNGSKRLLGSYAGASFSPQGKFVVVTRGRRVTAVEPDGDYRWSVSQPQLIAHARWAPGGYRVAYRAGSTLRVVVANGTDDRLVAPEVAPVAPAWRPAPAVRNVLAYADAAGRVNVVDVDSRSRLSRTRPIPRVRELHWSADGKLLLVVTGTEAHPILDARGRTVRALELARGHVLVDAEFAPSGPTVAYTDFDPARETSTLVADDGTRVRTLQSGEGKLEDVAWSPNGRWLLVGWPDANQWLFLRVPGVRKIGAVNDIRREFDPGGESAGEFPRIAGWCCAP